MVTVAVAGGTGGVGQTIVEAITAAGRHDVKILSRQPNPALEKQLGVAIIPVDYSDIQRVTKILEDNNIHTIISAIMMIPKPGQPPREIELIRAADASKTTKRYMASAWGRPSSEEDRGRFPSIGCKLDAEVELKKTTNLEYTRIYPGYFMDYIGMPGVKSNMTRLHLVMDIENDAAAIPGSGNTLVVLTHTADMAKYVAASLDLDKWDPGFFVRGDTVSWGDVLRLAQEAKGTKFNVAYDSVEKLKKGEITELPAQVASYAYFPKPMSQAAGAAFGLWFENEDFDMKPERWLNDYFPEIKPMTVKEVLDKAWKKR